MRSQLCEAMLPGGGVKVAAGCPRGVERVDLLYEAVGQDVVLACSKHKSKYTCLIHSFFANVSHINHQSIL
jgi:hypothetical protein